MNEIFKQNQIHDIKRSKQKKESLELELGLVANLPLLDPMAKLL